MIEATQYELEVAKNDHAQLQGFKDENDAALAEKQTSKDEEAPKLQKILDLTAEMDPEF
jgi:hypothetical protein